MDGDRIGKIERKIPLRGVGRASSGRRLCFIFAELCFFLGGVEFRVPKVSHDVSQFGAP